MIVRMLLPAAAAACFPFCSAVVTECAGIMVLIGEGGRHAG